MSHAPPSDRPPRRRLVFVCESGTDVRLVSGLRAHFELVLLLRPAFGARTVNWTSSGEGPLRTVEGPSGRLAFAAFAASWLRRQRGSYDVVLSPTFGRVAPKIPPGWQWPVPMEEWIAYTYLTNMTGTPSVSVPCGFVDGLPVGLQVMGRAGAEATVLRVAAALEQLQPRTDARPPL